MQKVSFDLPDPLPSSPCLLFRLLKCLPWLTTDPCDAFHEHPHPFLTRQILSSLAFNKKNSGNLHTICLQFLAFCLPLLPCNGFSYLRRPPPPFPSTCSVGLSLYTNNLLQSMLRHKPQDWHPCTMVISGTDYLLLTSVIEKGILITYAHFMSVFNGLAEEAQGTCLCACEDSTGIVKRGVPAPPMSSRNWTSFCRHLHRALSRLLQNTQVEGQASFQY